MSADLRYGSRIARVDWLRMFRAVEAAVVTYQCQSGTSAARLSKELRTAIHEHKRMSQEDVDFLLSRYRSFISLLASCGDPRT